MDLMPLVWDFALGFLASILSPRAALRIITCWLIPLVLTFLALGPENIVQTSGEGSMIWVAFCSLFLPGTVASGVGSLLGYLVRRFMVSKS